MRKAKSLEEQVEDLWREKFVGRADSDKSSYLRDCARSDNSEHPELPYWDVEVAHSHYQIFKNRVSPEDKTAELISDQSGDISDYCKYMYDEKSYHEYLQRVHDLIKKQLLRALTSRYAYVRGWAQSIKDEVS
jgi:hypothetical protein